MSTQHVLAYSKRPSNSIIWIHVKRSDSLVACTCGGLYYSAESLLMDFTLPHTSLRLVHNHLEPLSCQRLGLHVILTTWTNLLYVSLTNSLECQDAALLESLFRYIHYKHHHKVSTRESWNYVKLIPYTCSHTSMIISYQTQQNLNLIISHKTYMASYFMR